MEFHWWYIPIALILLFIIFGKGKGGVVVKRLTAELEVLDPRFQHCRPEADYCIFKEGQPHHIDIEIKNLFIATGEELEFLINGKALATVKVKRNREAEFDHWSDEGTPFPAIKENDELLVRYQGEDVLKGTFC